MSKPKESVKSKQYEMHKMPSTANEAVLRPSSDMESPGATLINKDGTMRPDVCSSRRGSYAKWVERLCMLKEMRCDMEQESWADHIISNIDICIDTVKMHLDSAFYRESTCHHTAEPTARGDANVKDPTKSDADDVSGLGYPDAHAPNVAMRRAGSPYLSYEEEVLPGKPSYTMDDVVESLDTLSIAEDGEDDIPDGLALEASHIEYHFNKQLVHKLYSRKWMKRINAVDEIVTLLERNSILEDNGNSIQQAVGGVGMVLSRLFQDHALKVLIKSLELLDAFFSFMERNGCCALTSARGSTARSNAVNCGSEFLEVLIGRLADRVSAVVNCAVCALLKVAESSTIPTYEDVANCLLRSLSGYNQHPGFRSICNRLRLLSTILLRAHKYNSHSVSRLSIKPCHFFDCVSTLCHHSNGHVRAMALEALAVGLNVYFKDVTVNVDSTLKAAAGQIPLQSVSTYEGEADLRTRQLLSEAQATWAVDILRARTPSQ